MTIGLVFIGGGHAAKVLLNLFLGDEQSRVLGVVDPNPNAEGIKRAQELGIQTDSDMSKMIKRPEVNVIVELTGNAAVRQRAINEMRQDQEIITASGARILVNMVKRQTDFQDVFGDLMARMQSAIGDIDKTADQTQEVLDDFKILALNAQIVAAKIGSSGAGFGAVVNQMKELIANIETLVSDIHGTSDESNEVLDLLKVAEGKLRHEAA
ncbi:MAG TPA: hypothetical protein PK961_01665 [bacterium]|nr:hypothetical protein [bacterium]